MKKSRFVTITTTKRIGLLIASWLLEKKISTDATFSIANLIDKSNIYQDIYFKIGDELREFNNVSLQPEPEI